MEFRDMIAVIALFISLFLGPVTAVMITLWWQQRKEKRDTKRQLFFTIMSHRRAMWESPEWVIAINLIDVVFADHARVIALWGQLYDIFRRTPFQVEVSIPKYLEMLSAMAQVLGFQQLQQLDIAKYYSPQYRDDQLKAQAELQGELLRVLKATAAVVVEKKPD